MRRPDFLLRIPGSIRFLSQPAFTYVIKPCHSLQSASRSWFYQSRKFHGISVLLLPIYFTANSRHSYLFFFFFFSSEFDNLTSSLGISVLYLDIYWEINREIIYKARLYRMNKAEERLINKKWDEILSFIITIFNFLSWNKNN